MDPKIDSKIRAPPQIKTSDKYVPEFPIGDSPVHFELSDAHNVSVEPRQLVK